MPILHLLPDRILGHLHEVVTRQNLSRRRTSRRTQVEHRTYQLYGCHAEVGRCFVLAGSNLLVEVFLVVFVEGQTADEHAVETDAKTPDVDFDRIVLDTVYYFGCGKARRAAARF